MTFAAFAFATPWIPAAFFVAGFVAMFKVQWQCFFYLFTVVSCVQTWEQWMLITAIFMAQIYLNRMYHAAGSGWGKR